MANNITSANAVFIITVPALGIVHQLQGFAADDAFDVDAFELAETQMGVDGKMSAGFIPTIKTQAIHLAASSDSISVFDQIYQFTIANKTPYEITGTISYTSVKKSYSLINGVLKSYKPLPDAKRVLSPQDFTIDWEAIIPSII